MILIYIIVYEIAKETNTFTNVARNAISSSHAIIINICGKLIKHIATKQRTIQNRTIYSNCSIYIYIYIYIYNPQIV